ncbi:MAG: hypothetical protein ACRDAM_01900 [Casimicrobium sp.]
MFNRLPDAWVKKILERLHVRYGEKFAKLYAGIDPQMVEDDWAETLGGFAGRAEAIQYALANLPFAFPPNALEFRDLCRQYKPPPMPMLTAARDPNARERMEEVAESVKSEKKPRYDYLRWARDPASLLAAKAVAERIERLDVRMIDIGADLVRNGHKYAGPIKEAFAKIRRQGSEQEN